MSKWSRLLVHRAFLRDCLLMAAAAGGAIACCFGYFTVLDSPVMFKLGLSVLWFNFAWKVYSMYRLIRRTPRSDQSPVVSPSNSMDKSPNISPPRIGKFIVCLFVPLDRQDDRLGDLEETFNTLWVKEFGVRLAKFIYIWHAVRIVVVAMGIGAFAAFKDYLWGILGR